MRSPNPIFIDCDTVLYKFDDTDLKMDTTPRVAHDESMRRIISERFATDLKTDPPRTDLERLLALAREREQFCRGANDSFGLARCLGNQALIQKARGCYAEALTLVQQLEPFCRRIDDVEGRAFALTHQAALLAGPLHQPETALPLAEQARQLAEANHFSQLASQATTLLEGIRAKLQTPE